MKDRIILILACAIAAISCAERSVDVEIIPVRDNATPRLMPRALFAEAPDSRLLPALDSCGVTADQVDCIFITHLHGDHIGGLMKDGKPVFTKAGVYINKVEYDAWMAMEHNDAVKAIAQAYGDRMKTFDLDDELPCGVEPVKAYGHTPGHTAYKVGNALIVGDIMHGVALQKDYPQYCARFDMDVQQSVNTRKEMMRMAGENGLRVYGMHFPSPYYL